ncbi:hypothetical protein [Chitinophaga sancti]|uniref:Signal transducing protein n=1 Tax=Chitinophaga sancti TaxID=1004 RepID=A0A1K1SFM6_9BACT|nr:hypothetical protein [Chitinophaga sancti]WQD59834.1 hypothetical protein U0033_18255 [Chitinophaga sancti]WQG88035.1 hypothetical protein SR876_24210 [Chitinophaga sancti]SFW83179.1 hypothetical protein SAMN05661012_05359 [Chitinophaga sancti]
MTPYITYRIFESREEAAAMQELLSKNGIPNTMEEGKAIFDTPIVGAMNIQHYFVKIPQDQFLAANALLEAAIDLNTLEVEDDYYLLSFTNAELLDLVKKKDEWGEFDYALAKKLLAERGISLGDAELKEMHEDRLQELKKTEVPEVDYIWGGYIAAVLNTVGGAGIGLYLLSAYRKLPDGTIAYKFDKDARRHGLFILILSIGVVLGHMAYCLYQSIPFSPTKVIFFGFGDRFF